MDEKLSMTALTDEIVEYEEGTATEEEEVAVFQALIDADLMSRLEEGYVRRARELESQGYISGFETPRKKG